MQTVLSIVIVSYNVRELLQKCLQSIYAHITMGVEVLVVDNHSGDESVSMVKKLFPGIILVENAMNRGFPAANNQGFERTKGKYILMLNPDTELRDNSLEKLIRYLEARQEAAIIAPRLLNTDGSFQDSAWRFPGLCSVFTESFYLNRLYDFKKYSGAQLSHTTGVDSVSGAALIFRRELLEDIGGLDECMFWIEDVEFCYRAKKRGHQVIFCPEAEVIHHSGQSAKTNYRVAISNQVFNKVKFFRKYKDKPQLWFIIIISYVHVVLKLLVFGVLSPLGPVYFQKAKAYLYTLPRVAYPPLKLE